MPGQFPLKILPVHLRGDLLQILIGKGLALFPLPQAIFELFDDRLQLRVADVGGRGHFQDPVHLPRTDRFDTFGTSNNLNFHVRHDTLNAKKEAEVLSASFCSAIC